MDAIILELLQSILNKEATTDERVKLIDGLCKEWLREKAKKS
jgi:hypothetical protein